MIEADTPESRNARKLGTNGSRIGIQTTLQPDIEPNCTGQGKELFGVLAKDLRASPSYCRLAPCNFSHRWTTSGLQQSTQNRFRRGDHFQQADLNEAAGAADAFACC